MTIHFCPNEPPSSNRGVPRADPPTLLHLPAPRFDWYQATVKGTPADVIKAFTDHFGGEFSPSGGLYSFKESAIHDDLGLRVLWGGRNADPHIQATSQDAAPVADFIRSAFPAHKVSRADVCWDFSLAGGFDLLRSIIEPIARKSRASVCLIGDPDPNSTKGQTIYFGSRKSSDLFIRLYQKGLERRAAGVVDADPDWVRLEVVVRPRKGRKADAATMQPQEFVGFSKWASQAVSEALGVAIPFLPDTTLRKSRDDEAFAHMCKQYGRLLRRLVEKDGWAVLQGSLYREIYTASERNKMERREN